MKNREKEYISIVIITLLHGIYTYCALGKIPHISFTVFDDISICAFFLWMLYSACLYLIVQVWIIQVKSIKKQCIWSVVFGGISAFIKGGIDFVIGKLGDYLQSVIKSVCLDEVATFIFFILLVYVLLVVVARKRISRKKNIKLPLCILITIVVCYIVFVCNYLWQNQTAIEQFSANEEEIFNLDYHFGMKILDGNVWFYIIFYIAFWWFMRRVTEK